MARRTVPNRRTLILGLLAAAPPALAALAWGADARGAAASLVEVPVEETRARRDRLAAELRKELQPDERGVLYLLGARAPEDVGEFRQTPNFHYLTGLAVPGAGMILSFDASDAGEKLFLPPRNPAAERWTGTALGPGGVEPLTGDPDGERRAAAVLTGFRGPGGAEGGGIGEIGDIRAALSWRLADGAALFLDYDPPPLDAPPTPESAFVAEVRARYPQARIAGARPALARLRSVKSAEEIRAVRKAVEITCEAQAAAMRALRPGVKEYEIEAAVEHAFTRSGARFPSFPSVVGSGPNSCVLHYSRNDRTIQDGDLVVVDVGAEYARYAADVTRTLPASGRYTDEQRRVYGAVLRAQAEAKALVRPGARIRDVNERVLKVLEEAGLKDRALHGCCHFVGLDVHDVGDRDALLVPGMVLTVEPGAYLPEKEIGVRIEDVFLVTEDGAEQLSACVTSSPEEIEALMARPDRSGPGRGAPFYGHAGAKAAMPPAEDPHGPAPHALRARTR